MSATKKVAKDEVPPRHSLSGEGLASVSKREDPAEPRAIIARTAAHLREQVLRRCDGRDSEVLSALRSRVARKQVHLATGLADIKVPVQDVIGHLYARLVASSGIIQRHVACGDEFAANLGVEP